MICTYILINFTYFQSQMLVQCVLTGESVNLWGVTQHVFSTLHALFTI